MPAAPLPLVSTQSSMPEDWQGGDWLAYLHLNAIRHAPGYTTARRRGRNLETGSGCHNRLRAPIEPRNIGTVLADLRDHWSPRTIAIVNDYDVRVVKVQGEFTRHSHPETDEFFLVLSGQLTIAMDEGNITLSQGDTFVVPVGMPTSLTATLRPPCCCSSPAKRSTRRQPSSLTAARTVI